VLVGVGLAALAGGLLGAYFLGGDDGTSARSSSSSAPVKFVNAQAYDPDGDGQEHDSEASNAVDGNPGTFWTTEHYNGADLGKAGVGIVLTANREASPRALRVTTDTDGFTAQVRAGNSASGQFHAVSPKETVNGTTSFPIRGRGRYFLLWITDLGGNESVHVNEVRAR
jgi:hypothetical protein